MGKTQKFKKLVLAASGFLSDLCQMGKTVPENTAARKRLEETSPDPKTSAWLPSSPWTEPVFDLSIIVPAYRTEPFLKRAIESILSQKTRFSFELILIDDGSPDDCGRIMDAYAHLPNVQVIHQENKGFSGARNAGIDRIRGSHLTFVDSDDLLPPGALEALMTPAMEKGAEIVEGNISRFADDGTLVQETFHETKACDPQTELLGYCCGKVYKAELFKNLRFPENYWYEDSINAAILFPLCKTAYTVSDVIYHYYQNPQGISRLSQGRPKSIDSLYITESLLLDLPKFGLTTTQRDYEYFLTMVVLTYHRTWLLVPAVKRAVFAQQCRLREDYFSTFSSPAHEKLEKSLKTRNYITYALYCELNR